MSVIRKVRIDKIEWRPNLDPSVTFPNQTPPGQIGVTRIVETYENENLVSTNILQNYYKISDDISEEDEIVKKAAELFWSEP